MEIAEPIEPSPYQLQTKGNNMPTPVSVPTPQPVPSTSPYGISVLDLFQTYTRSSFFAAFGVESPPFNSAWPVKNWFDSTANPAVPTVYYSLATATQGATSQIILPAEMAPFLLQPGQANVLNLIDEVVAYLPYTVQPTTAYESSGPYHLPINPYYLSTPEQAQQFSQILGGGPVTNYQLAAGPAGNVIVYPDLATDPRQWYEFKDSHGQTQYPGLLLLQENALGVGHPGSWVDNGTSWAWQAAYVPPPVAPTGPLVPMPMRQLLPTEQVVSVSMGMGVMVVNQA